jgi:putative tricarboxylic transport membrane protein
VKLSDAIFGLLLLALGAVVIAVVSSYPTIPAQRVGPSLFPALIALGLVIGGLILLVRGWRVRVTVAWIQFEPWVHSPRHVAGVLGVIGSVVLTVLFRLFGVAFGRSIVIAAIATFVIHFAFYKLLRVPLPWGLLTNYAW